MRATKAERKGEGYSFAELQEVVPMRFDQILQLGGATEGSS